MTAVPNLAPAPVNTPLVSSSGTISPPWLQWFTQALQPRANSAVQVSTGDVVLGGGANATATIQVGAVTLAKMAQMAADSLIGNNGSVGATPQALNQAQVTALLNLFTSVLQGLVPPSGGGILNYLRADGTWDVPHAAGPAGGDLSGTYPNPTVEGLLGMALPALTTGGLYYNGTSWTFSPSGGYTLPTATPTVLGGVKPDGVTILNAAGVLSATPASIGALPVNAQVTAIDTTIPNFMLLGSNGSNVASSGISAVYINYSIANGGNQVINTPTFPGQVGGQLLLIASLITGVSFANCLYLFTGYGNTVTTIAGQTGVAITVNGTAGTITITNTTGQILTGRAIVLLSN